MLLSTALLTCLLTLSAGSSCSNRLYRGQRLNASQYLCSRNQNYRMSQKYTGHVIINESFPRENFFGPPPPTLFSTNNSTKPPSYMAITDSGDFIAADADNSVYWRANVSGADFLELQDTGRAVLFSKNTSLIRVLWKSLSTYSLRLVGGADESVGRLEFYFNETWGAVSSYSFDSPDANVACRTLGFNSGQIVTNTFGPSSGPMWMDQMTCNGKEDAFQECPFGWWRDVSPRYWWGMVLDSSHSYDVAISCQGSSTLGVLYPTAHVCTDRLFVGQTLSLGESLCAGQNGEVMLRFTNKRTDAGIELFLKNQRKWMLGMKTQAPAGKQLHVDIDGVLRISDTVTTDLPYNVYNETIANASFLELQDIGVARIVSADGNTGWRKAPEDLCYNEQPNMRASDSAKFIGSANVSSMLECLDACSNTPNCTTIVSYYVSPSCALYGGFPWDTSSSNSTYYEKIPQCPSGFSCYREYPYNRWDADPYLNSNNSISSPSACTNFCDSTAKCISANFNPATKSCYVNYKRLNDSTPCTFWTTYYRKTPCTTLAPSQVLLLPVKECPKKLYPGSSLRPREYLCSANGGHVVTVEKDMRIVIDGGKWTSNIATNCSGYLQYTSNNQLFLRLDDGSVSWQADSTSPFIKNMASGYLALSDDGKLQMYSSAGLLIWNHETGFAAPAVFAAPLDDAYNFNEMQLIDGNSTTCVSGRATNMLLYRLRLTRSITAFVVGLVGRNLQCGADSTLDTGIYVLTTSQELMNGSERTCKLQTASPLACSFECSCESSLCTILSLLYLGCGIPIGTLCETFIVG